MEGEWEEKKKVEIVCKLSDPLSSESKEGLLGDSRTLGVNFPRHDGFIFSVDCNHSIDAYDLPRGTSLYPGTAFGQAGRGGITLCIDLETPC